MFRYHRPVRFAEIDAARLVFFPRFHEYCHDALEALFAGLPGGYAKMVAIDDVGIPTVQLDTTFKAPLRHGDAALCQIDVMAIGRSSITFRHTIRRESDGEVCAVVRHVVVTARLGTLTAIPVPDPVRQLLVSHLLTPP
jgi:4-hydroxybenzoyl-CoA thioesterase